MATPTFTKTGTRATSSVKLDDSVFNVVIKNHELVKLAYDAYLANGRANLAVVKTRGLVSGGGKKPWKQKGTGRARFGSSRNPIWRGGGIVFGPTGNENYSKQLNQKASQLAVRQALSLAAQAKKIVVIEEIDANGKTAALATLLTKIGVTGRTLLVTNAKEEKLDRAAANLRDVKVVQAGYVNVFDIMNADAVVLTKSAVTAVQERLGGVK